MAARDELDIPIPAMAPSYRPSARRREEMDPATRRLAIFAGVIGAALLGLVAVWAFTGHHQGGVPVVEAPSGPVKVKPANPGGLQVPGANDEILSGGGDGKETVAPGPETPAPQALKAEEQAAAQAANPPATAAPAQPEAAQTAPATAEAPPAPAPTVTQPLPALRPHPAARSNGAPAGSASSEGNSSVRLIPGTRPPGPMASAEPPPRPAVRPAARPAPAESTQSSRSLALHARTATGAPLATAAGTAPAAARAAPVVPPAPSQPAGRRALVQLAAVGSGEAATKEWDRLSHKYPDLFAGHAPNITKTEHDGKTYWRIRTGGFGDPAQATAFCQRAKAKGLACTVAAL